MQVNSTISRLSKLSISVDNSHSTVFDKIEDHIPMIALRVLAASNSTKDLTNFFCLFHHTQKQEILKGSSELVSKILQTVQGDFEKLKPHWQKILKEIGHTITSLHLGKSMPGVSKKQFQTLQVVFPNIQELTVQNRRRKLSLNFSVWSKTLTTLVLDGNVTTLTDAALSHLSRFTALTHLSLKRCKAITYISPLCTLTAMKVLHFEGCENVTCASFATLQKFQNLETLSLCKVKPSVLVHLQKARYLQHLSLSCSQNEINKLSFSNKSLKSLTLNYEPLSSSELDDIVQKNNQLCVVNLSSAVNLDDSYLESICKLSSLHELDLSYTALEGRGLKFLQKNPKLSYLKLDYCKALRSFSYLPQVTHLSLKRFLNCDLTFVDNKKVNLALCFPNLLSLNLSYQDNAPFLLQTLSLRVRTLALIECKNLTGNDLDCLRSKPCLRSLDLTGCAKLDDTCYVQLKTLTQLKYLNLRYTRMSQIVVDKLKKELKFTQIEFFPRDYTPKMLRDLWAVRLS
jgi:hypothetical protein